MVKMNLVDVIESEYEDNVGKNTLLIVCMAIVSIVFLIWVLVIQSDFYVIWKAPKKEVICQRVNEAYGVNVEPEDITEILVTRDLLGDAIYSLETNKRSPQVGEYSAVVEYYFSYVTRKETYEFVAKYSTKSGSITVERKEK